VTRTVAVREAGRTATIQRTAASPAGSPPDAPDIKLPPTPDQVPSWSLLATSYEELSKA
jgi:hypothetical protein